MGPDVPPTPRMWGDAVAGYRRRICGLVAGLGVVACAGGRNPRGTTLPEQVQPSTVSPAPTTASAEELATAGEQALASQDYAQAIARFGQALRAEPEGEVLRRALLGMAGAHERVGDCTGVLRALASYASAFPSAPDIVAIWARRGACQAELGAWQDSADSFIKVAQAEGQLPSTRIEALARAGYALYNLDRFDDASELLARADQVFERAQQDQTERFSTYYFVAMARFYRAAMLHRRFREVVIRLPEPEMAKGFKRKLQLLSAAQEAYNHTIKAKHVFWVSAAGFQLGHLFGEFYDEMMYAPVPTWLDQRQRQIYYEELNKQLRPVLERAI